MAKITIIEDQADLLRGIKNLINASDIHICDYSFDNAEDAIKEINSYNTDIVLMDIDLPGMSGIAATLEIKKRYPGIHVIMLTVFEDPDSVFNALKNGATGFLLKSAAPSKIIDSLDDVLEGGSPMNREIARMVVNSFNQPVQKNITMEELSKREMELLELLSKGYRYKEIGETLFISTNTVRTHIRHIYEKLQVRSRMEAINKVYKT